MCFGWLDNVWAAGHKTEKHYRSYCLLNIYSTLKSDQQTFSSTLIHLTIITWGTSSASQPQTHISIRHKFKSFYWQFRKQVLPNFCCGLRLHCLSLRIGINLFIATKSRTGSRTAPEMDVLKCFTQGHSLQIYVTLGNQTIHVQINWGHFQEQLSSKVRWREENQVVRF